jgi:lysophospholipase L1-like esterase
MRHAILAALMLSTPLLAADDFLRDGSRVLFLGDSNTYAGRFIAYLDAYAASHFPERKVELINLGLPSETVSGLSEPDHPFPRPNVHDRLAAALTKARPTVVVACYGMNDGIYYPFDEGRFRKYQDGYRKLIADCEKAGAKVVLMTPAPFDPKPLKGKVQAKGAEKYSWLKPYVDYDDETLRRYAQWLVTLRDKGYVVVDAHSAVRNHLETMRKVDPNYAVSADGIHPDASGHLVIFRELANAFRLSVDGFEAKIDTAEGKSTSAEISDIRIGPGKLEFTWALPAPFPRDSAWHHRLIELERLDTGLTRFRLLVTGLPAGSHALYEGDKLIGSATAEEWKAGVDVGRWKDLSANKRSAETWDEIQKKQRILGMAWLTDVGHNRPDTKKGISLNDAKKYADEVDVRVRKLAAPEKMRLRIAAAK